MIGGLILIAGLVLGGAAVSFLSVIPLSILGVLLVIVAIYHATLVRDLKDKRQLAVVGIVTIVTFALGSLAFGFGAGILLYHILKVDTSRLWRRFLGTAKHHR